VLLAVSLVACPRPQKDDTRARAANEKAAGSVAKSGEPAAPSAPSATEQPVSREALSRIQVAPGTKGRVPFVLWLHGLGSSGEKLARGLGVAALAKERHFAYATPDGALDKQGRRFWNASRACCNFDRAEVDHVAELGELIRAARAHPSVDPARIYLIGFSNGGFMAHRMACDVAGITAIASIAGAGPAGTCAPSMPVAVLHVHGDADTTVRYAGGRVFDSPALEPHASARDTVGGWAKRNVCVGEPKSSGELDIQQNLPGNETVISAHSGCSQPVELWTVRGGNHFVASSRPGLETVLAFLEKQVKR
jgi:polyhydroxybutyrate depolymerase